MNESFLIAALALIIAMTSLAVNIKRKVDAEKVVAVEQVCDGGIDEEGS